MGERHKPRHVSRPLMSEERRAWLRMDDQILLECRKAGDETEPVAGSPPSDRAIADFIFGSTASLLSRIKQGEDGERLVPWLMKIDWTLDLILRALCRTCPEAVTVPKLTDVNLSAGGIRFSADQPVRPHEQLELNLILPPFTPVRTIAEVLRVQEGDPLGGPFKVATKFLSLSPDDRERIIRHVFCLDSARLRRHYASQNEDPSV